MWAVAIMLEGEMSFTLPPVDEEMAHTVLDSLRLAYPKLQVGLLEVG